MSLSRSSQKNTRAAGRLVRWVDGRPRIAPVLASARRRAVPDHWSLLFGQIAVASFTVCSLSGIFLVFFYEPSTAPVTYEGSYAALRGVEMSRALESTLDLSFEVRGGLLMRQLHHWSASVMIAAVMLHLLRIFFTGAFRRPRGVTWLLWFGVLLAGMGAGLTGHVLPDDARSGMSLMVMDGLLKGIPLIGTSLSSLVFQDRFPAGAIDTFHPVHVVILPALILALLLVIGLLNLRHRPAQFRGPGRTERNIVGRPLTVALVKSGGLFCIVVGVLTSIAATMQVNPVWMYGPADPAVSSAGSGALWYLAFLDGAQRLVPPGWELVLFDRTWTPAIFMPLAVGGLFFLTAMIYPVVERWVSGDHEAHHLLARPRTAPRRTGIGVAGIVFYAVLWIAAGSDVIALRFSLSNESLILTLRIALVVGPILGFTLTKRHLPRPPAQGSRDRPARLRDRHDRPQARRQVHRSSPAGRCAAGPVTLALLPPHTSGDRLVFSSMNDDAMDGRCRNTSRPQEGGAMPDPSTPGESEPPKLVDAIRERSVLLGLSYRLLGSLTDAEDAVQETYIRWYRLTEQERREVIHPRAWLVKTASRIGLDMLKSARARREQYIGEWLPEPLPAAGGWSSQHAESVIDPADRVTLDDSVSMAVLVMLEAMTPAERVAFILHDVFQYSFSEVAEIVGRTPAASRQLASSARRRVREQQRRSVPAAETAAAVRSFKAAWQTGDLAALIDVLDPHATAITDGGGLVSAALEPLHGALAVARFLIGVHERQPGLTIREELVNGEPGLVATDTHDRTLAVLALSATAEGKVDQVWAVRNPQKLGVWAQA